MLHIRTNLFDNYSYIFASAGFSYRIDRHQDALIESQETTHTKNKKGFFSKLFGKN